MSKKIHQSDEPIIPQYFTLGGILLVVGWVSVLVAFVLLSLDKSSLDKAASIGDAFGSINSLFSILALLAAIAGTLIQGKEFRKQLEEMTKSAAEMEKQTATYEAQLVQLTTQTSILREQAFQDRLGNYIKELPLFSVISFEATSSSTAIAIKNYGTQVLFLSGCVPKFESTDTLVSTLSEVLADNVVSRLTSGQDVIFKFSHGHRLAIWPITLELSYILVSGIPIKESLCIGSDCRAFSDRANQISKLTSTLVAAKAS